MGARFQARTEPHGHREAGQGHVQLGSLVPRKREKHIWETIRDLWSGLKVSPGDEERGEGQV